MITLWYVADGATANKAVLIHLGLTVGKDMTLCMAPFALEFVSGLFECPVNGILRLLDLGRLSEAVEATEIRTASRTWSART